MLKETQHIEFKPTFNEDVIETIVAFANTKGGKALVGVIQVDEVLNFVKKHETPPKSQNLLPQRSQRNFTKNTKCCKTDFFSL